MAKDLNKQKQLEIKTLGKVWDKGIASGAGKYKNIDAIKKAARAKQAKSQA